MGHSVDLGNRLESQVLLSQLLAERIELAGKQPGESRYRIFGARGARRFASGLCGLSLLSVKGPIRRSNCFCGQEPVLNNGGQHALVRKGVDEF